MDRDVDAEQRKSGWFAYKPQAAGREEPAEGWHFTLDMETNPAMAVCGLVIRDPVRLRAAAPPASRRHGDCENVFRSTKG